MSRDPSTVHGSPACSIKELEEARMALHRASLSLKNSPYETLRFTLGVAVLCCIVLCLGARPSWMPWLYLGIAVIVIPSRVIGFTKKGWAFFLLDFCYVSPRGRSNIIIWLLDMNINASTPAHTRFSVGKLAGHNLVPDT